MGPAIDLNMPVRQEQWQPEVEHRVMRWTKNKHVFAIVQTLMASAERTDVVHLCVEQGGSEDYSLPADLATVMIRPLETSRFGGITDNASGGEPHRFWRCQNALTDLT
jgi:hypothetical protein